MSYEQLKLENQLCFRLYTVSRLVIQAYRPYLEPLKLTYPQYIVLLTLWEKDHQLVNAIAHRLYLESNTITPLLQRLEKQGLVKRERGKEDGRQILVSLTKQGRELQEKAKHIPSCLTKTLEEKGLVPEKLLPLIAPLDELIHALSKDYPAACNE